MPPLEAQGLQAPFECERQVGAHTVTEQGKGRARPRAAARVRWVRSSSASPSEAYRGSLTRSPRPFSSSGTTSTCAGNSARHRWYRLALPPAWGRHNNMTRMNAKTPRRPCAGGARQSLQPRKGCYRSNFRHGTAKPRGSLLHFAECGSHETARCGTSQFPVVFLRAATDASRGALGFANISFSAPSKLCAGSASRTDPLSLPASNRLARRKTASANCPNPRPAYSTGHAA